MCEGDSQPHTVHRGHRTRRRQPVTSSPHPRRVHVAGSVLIQPFLGGEERTRTELALGKDDGLLLEGVLAGGGHTGPRGGGVEVAEAFPPAMVVVGGFDLLRDWQARYVGTLRVRGKMVRVVEYPDAVHAFHVFPELADFGKLVEEVKLFVDEHRSS